MSALPLSVIPLAGLNNVISARRGEGAHSYYNSGWKIKDTPKDAHAITPGFFLENGNYTVVFEHTGSQKTKKFSLALGVYKAHHESKVSIQTENKLTCEVKERNVIQHNKPLPLDGIEMVGFHVWRFERTKNALEVFLDGRRCVQQGSITDKAGEYTVLIGDPSADSPIVVWETHQIIPDITKNFDPRYQYEHKLMKLGVGSYVEFYGEWDAPGGEIFVDGTPHSYDEIVNPGEQTLVLRVLSDKCFVTSSLKPLKIFLVNQSPIVSNVDITRPAKKLYNLTIFFAEIKA